MNAKTEKTRNASIVRIVFGDDMRSVTLVTRGKEADQVGSPISIKPTGAAARRLILEGFRSAARAALADQTDTLKAHALLEGYAATIAQGEIPEDWQSQGRPGRTPEHVHAFAGLYLSTGKETDPAAAVERAKEMLSAREAEMGAVFGDWLKEAKKKPQYATGLGAYRMAVTGESGGLDDLLR